MKKLIPAILSAVCFGSIGVLAKLSMLTANTQTILITRIGIVVSIILLTLLLSGKLKTLKISKQHIPIMLIAGLVLGIETVIFWNGLTYLTIIELIALFWTYPLFILLYDVILGEIKDKAKSFVLILIGLIGVYIAMGGLDFLC